jgi:hypothetical protein
VERWRIERAVSEAIFVSLVDVSKSAPRSNRVFDRIDVRIIADCGQGYDPRRWQERKEDEKCHH